MTDRTLAEIFDRASRARDWNTARKAHKQIAERSEWGIYDREKFPISDEALERWGQYIEAGTQLESAGFFEEPPTPIAVKFKQPRPPNVTVDNDESAAARRELARILRGK